MSLDFRRALKYVDETITRTYDQAQQFSIATEAIRTAPNLGAIFELFHGAGRATAGRPETRRDLLTLARQRDSHDSLEPLRRRSSEGGARSGEQQPPVLAVDFPEQSWVRQLSNALATISAMDVLYFVYCDGRPNARNDWPVFILDVFRPARVLSLCESAARALDGDFFGAPDGSEGYLGRFTRHIVKLRPERWKVVRPTEAEVTMGLADALASGHWRTADNPIGYLHRAGRNNILRRLHADCEREDPKTHLAPRWLDTPTVTGDPWGALVPARTDPLAWIESLADLELAMARVGLSPDAQLMANRLLRDIPRGAADELGLTKREAEAARKQLYRKRTLLREELLG